MKKFTKAFVAALTASAMLLAGCGSAAQETAAPAETTKETADVTTGDEGAPADGVETADGAYGPDVQAGRRQERGRGIRFSGHDNRRVFRHGNLHRREDRGISWR